MSILGPNGRPIGGQNDYDAAKDKGRRKPASQLLTSEDAKLPQPARNKVTGGARSAVRNFSIASWMIRCHLDYVSRFSFHSQTNDEALDAEIEDFVEWWSKPRNCDVAGRRDLWRLLRAWEARRALDGDVVVLKRDTGHIQTIEGDRIRTPWPKELPKSVSPREFTHGVDTDTDGKHRAYCICSRQGLGAYRYKRILKAKFCEFHAYYCGERLDQVRGVSLLAPAINTLRDLYEAFTYALAKMKVAQLFGLVTYREMPESMGDVFSRDADGDGVPEKSSYEVDFSKGPIHLDLDPGDRAEWLENKTPTPEFAEFSLKLIQTALRGLDIPFSFFDESYTTYGGQRQAILQYDKSAEQKRDGNRTLASNLIRWRIRKAVLDGTLSLPSGMTVSDLKFGLKSAGVPWIDPLKEVQADLNAISGGLASRQEVCKRRGKDFFDIADELAAENEYLKKKGLPTEIETGNVTINEIAGE